MVSTRSTPRKGSSSKSPASRMAKPRSKSPTPKRKAPVARKSLANNSAAGHMLYDPFSAPWFLNNMTDPTMLFALNCLFSVVFLVGRETAGGGGTLELRALGELPSTLTSFFFDPAFLVAVVALLVVRGLAGNPTESLSRATRCRLGWYLWNGIVFHTMMDGMAGGKYGNALMQENYMLLDRRFKGPSGGAGEGDIALGTLIVNIELFLHAPLCFAAYVGIARNAKWQHEAELVALSFQLFGLFMFVVPEFMTECLNMVPHGQAGCFPAFTAFNFFYYWFGVGVNAVWLFVPLKMMASAVSRSAAAKK